jgi:hypothetical protein
MAKRHKIVDEHQLENDISKIQKFGYDIDESGAAAKTLRSITCLKGITLKRCYKPDA